MLRLPPFTYRRPTTIEDALAIAGAQGPDTAYVAGGTDLWPNMKRRQQTPRTVISLGAIEALVGIAGSAQTGLRIGPMTTLSALIAHPLVATHYPALAEAARLVSTPPLRNMGTIGGNLLIDTRCNYYNQSEPWRRAIDFCMKKDGKICWVAPSSPRCWAVQSSDSVPLMCALGAELVFRAPGGGERVCEADALYRNDGIDHLAKRPEELLTEIRLPPVGNRRAVYLKLRRRGSFDFPVLGVACVLGFDGDRVTDARIRIGGVGSHPRSSEQAQALLCGEVLSEERIEEAARLAAHPARPLDNTDFVMHWRKKMTRVYVARALRALRDGVPALAAPA